MLSISDTTTTDKYRPVKMSKVSMPLIMTTVWQCNSHSSNSNFSILDEPYIGTTANDM